MPNPIAIDVEGLSKRYQLGHQQRGYKALRDTLADAVRLPMRAARALTAGRTSGAASRPDEFWALQDVSFRVAQGEVIGVIGKNGAGKSTLLKVLSRITEPTKGCARVYGRVGSLLEVGSGFHPELSGRDNIYFNGSILGMRRAEIEQKFDEIVAFAEVEKFIDTPVKHYSSGMYMRLAFAVAAHLEPEILFVDEVLAVGDAAFQKKCLGKMGDVSRQGRTVLFVSHNMAALQTLCNRAVWLQNGQVVECGEARSVVGRYLQRSSEVIPQQSWDDIQTAPGGEHVRLQSIEVRPQGGQAGAPITVATPVEIEVTYWNRGGSGLLNVSVELFNMEGVLVFSSFCEPREYPYGLVRSTCFIPAHLMNDTIYRIRVLLVRNASTILLEHDSVSFEVHDVERTAAYFGRWTGVVRPALHWSSDVVERAHAASGAYSRVI